MRKLKSFLFLILCCYCFASCTSGDNPEYSNRIEGTWTVVHYYFKIRYPENGTWFEHEEENDFTYSESEIRDLDGNLIDVIKEWPFITFFKKKVELGPTMFKIPSNPISSAFDTSTPEGQDDLWEALSNWNEKVGLDFDYDKNMGFCYYNLDGDRLYFGEMFQGTIEFIGNTRFVWRYVDTSNTGVYKKYVYTLERINPDIVYNTPKL